MKLFACCAGLLALWAATGAVAPAAADPLKTCSLPDVSRPARCGSIVVPENRSVARGRTIALRVAVVSAQRGPAKRDPIAILLGGPGESAVEDASVFVRWLSPLLDDRDLLLVDQRGAGGSAPLTCKLGDRNNPAPLLKDMFPPAAVRRCTAELAKRADLTQYGYLNFADDLEHVRKTLDYGKLNLFGGSYGTRAEQVYLRRYPGSVRTVYLGSVVPIDIATPPTMARTAQVEMERLFDACAADARCAKAYPRLRTEFAVVMRRLEVGATVEVAGKRAVLHTAPAAAWFRAKLYRPSSAADLPHAIHRAFMGDWRAVADGAASVAESSLSFGLFFAITCNEDVRFINPASVAASSRGTFVGDTRVRQQQSACRYWPSSRLPEGYRKPVRSSLPTLFVAGEADGGTPVSFTDHAARNFGNKAIILAPGQGHTEWSPCIAARYADLVRRGDIAGSRRLRCPAIPRPPFKI